MPKLAVNVYVTREIPQAGLDIVRDACERVEINPEDRVLTRQELLAAVRGRDGVLCLLTDTVDAAVLDAAKGCRVFANYAVGYNNIDVPAATARGIAVTNTPGVLTDATADLTWALLFATARRIPEGDRYTRAGKFRGWSPMLLLGGDISGRTLGIIGAGRIGTAVALRSRGFRMRVLYFDRAQNEALEQAVGAERVDLDRLLRESDFVSVHVSLDESTRHLIGARELGLMKPTAYLVNTSRGPVVDENALVAALRERRIAGAGLDVFENEPALAPGLTGLDNVVIPPHLGSATIATRTRMATLAATNLVAALRGERPPNIVNPEVLA
ncbi:MAG TPA: D-glycerate dehydrogenase [Planctomycetota bacterium]|nr:D-glycerate dehydrogenase [Planctomycetota bacterium]HRR82719.1 D-glycerate dehydrogenase [Planctomycetota bacterium]HRT95948.1 D-glycerate dehydrogenase [Planctomycetota bacterium]